MRYLITILIVSIIISSAYATQTQVAGKFTITAYNTLTTPTLILSNTFIDQGQSILFTANILSTQGTAPYSYAYNVYATNSGSIITLIANQLYTGNSFTSNTWIWKPNANLYTSNTLFFANVIVTDGHPTTVNSVGNSFGYNSAPTLTISPSNVLLDSGQWETYTITATGGTGPKFNTQLYNVTGSTNQGANVLITSVGGSNTVSFQVNSPTESNSFQFNGISYDQGTTTPFFFNGIANTIVVNQLLAISLTPTTNSFIIGNTQVMTATVTPGQQPYTYNWLVSNTVGLVFNALYVGNSFTQNQFAFKPLAADVYQVEVIITDSASTKVTIASSNSVITVSLTQVYGVNCVNGNPTLNSSSLYQNTNSSTLVIFSDSNVINTGYYGASTTVSEIVNSTGTANSRMSTTMTLPTNYYFKYVFNSGTNIFHCQWLNPGLNVPTDPSTSVSSFAHILFVLMFCGALIFISLFLITLPGDLKKQSLRPLFLLLFAIGLWVGSLPAFLAPENTISLSYPAYNVTSGTQKIQFPAFTVNTISSLQVKSYNAYFYIWLSILSFLFFLLTLWFILLLREKAKEAMEQGSDTIQKLDERLSIK